MDNATISSLITQAAGHLNAAADLADQHGLGDPFSAWVPFAGQIRLVASGLSVNAEAVTPLAGGTDAISRHMQAAAAALDTVPPGEGPPDLCFWAWHLTDLQRQIPKPASLQ